MADHGLVRSMLVEAGFEDVLIQDMEFHLRFADFADYWDFIEEFAGATAILLRSLSAEDRSSVREATERAAERFRTPAGYDLPGLSVNVLAW